MTADPIGWSDAGRIDTQVARAVIKAGHPLVLRNNGAEIVPTKGGQAMSLSLARTQAGVTQTADQRRI
jgi:hypothetical protein